MLKPVILIPAYNATKTILETLASLESQRHEFCALRVVVADDASTDGTVQCVESFAAQSSLAVEVWRSPANGGERVTVNRAFERLRSEGVEWCLVLHADDVAKDHWVQVMLSQAKAASTNTVSICSSWDDWYVDRVVPGEDRPNAPVVVVQGGVETACGTLVRGCWWHFSGCAMHLPRFHQVGSFCEDMPQLGDLEWLVRASLSGFDINYIPQTLIKYRQLPGNVSSVSFKTSRDLRESLRILARHSGNDQLRQTLHGYAVKQSKVGARRVLTSALKGDFRRSRSALSATIQLWRAEKLLKKNKSMICAEKKE